MSTPDNGLTCECGHHVRQHDAYTPNPCMVSNRNCPCREFKSAEVGRLAALVAAQSERMGEFDAELAALKAENAKLVSERDEWERRYDEAWERVGSAIDRNSYSLEDALDVLLKKGATR